MDRRLSDQEKDEYRKQFGRPQKPDEPFRFSYKALTLWFMFILFLMMPQLVDYVSKVSGINPDDTDTQTTAPENPDDTIIRVYAARTWGTKGMFAVHSWIAMKQQGSDDWEVSQVIGWRQGIGGNVLWRERNVPIDSWWGKEATMLLELRGEEAESIIDKINVAIEEYPWKNEYTLYPGPNSNTFVSWVGVQVPEMGLDLPSTAIGKDWRPLDHSLGMSASGSGIQASLFGLLGTSIGYEEGLEINVLGLNFELDLFDLALEIPLFGRYSIWYLMIIIAVWLLIRKRFANLGKNISI